MTASRHCSPLVASEASTASTPRTTGARTGRQISGPAVRSPVRVSGRVAQAFVSTLAEPLNALIRLERCGSEPLGVDYRDLGDIGVTRIDIAAIRAGTDTRASLDDAERSVFCPNAGEAVTRTPAKHGPGSPSVRWDARSPQIMYGKSHWNITQ